MQIPDNTPARILEGSAEPGTVTPEMLQERAEQLAKMDGRPGPSETDQAQALAEMTGTLEMGTPELDDPALKNLTVWDESTEIAGHHTPTTFPTDEPNIGERLVEEGLEEADHEQRLAAVDEDPPDFDE